MLDNILYYDQEGLVLDVDILNTGSSQGIVYDELMQSVEGAAGDNIDMVFYDVLFQELEETGGGGINGSLTDRTIITVEQRYEERISNLSIFNP